VDDRQELALRASLAWYEDVFRTHGIPTQIEDGVWSARADPPRWHCAAKSLRPDVPASRLARAADAFAGCAVADSLFPQLPLVGYAHGAEHDILLAAGFRPTGPLAVWVRDG